MASIMSYQYISVPRRGRSSQQVGVEGSSLWPEDPESGLRTLIPAKTCTVLCAYIHAHMHTCINIYVCTHNLHASGERG